MHLDEFCLLMQEASHHLTNSSQYRFFASKIICRNWDEKALKWINWQIYEELDFIMQVFMDPSTYKWSVLIPHLIEQEPDYEIWQDSCLLGAIGFSFLFCFWWALEWPMFIVLQTIKYLSKGNKNLISINLLEYAAMIISLARAILVWESLPLDSRPYHQVCLL